MNEVQLIRSQLATERQRALEVASACAGALTRAGAQSARDGAALEAFGRACREYLACVLLWFEERDRRLGELYARLPPDDAQRHALGKLLAEGSRSHEALGRLTPASATGASTEAPDTGAPEAWRELARYLSEAWDARRSAIDALLAANPRVSDWRTFSGIDADSILEERSRYAQVRQTLPAGAALGQPGPAGVG
jgi:hypothetical protein